MKFYIIVAALIFACAGAISYGYDHLKLRRATRRKRAKLLAQLTSQPAVIADFTTPEGAVLCFEDCLQKKNVAGAVACRDFTEEARLWLQSHGHITREMQEQMLPETTRAMEKSFRDSLAKGLPPDWILGKSYFLKREPYADGILVVNKYTQAPEGALYSQQIIVTRTGNEWRLVKSSPPLDH